MLSWQQHNHESGLRSTSLLPINTWVNTPLLHERTGERRRIFLSFAMQGGQWLPRQRPLIILSKTERASFYNPVSFLCKKGELHTEGT